MSYELFLVVLSLYSLALILADLALPLSIEVQGILQWMDLMICILFLGDFVFRLLTAENKLVYLRWGWIDLLSSIPAVDVFRFGRVFRIVRVFRLFRAFRSVKQIVAYALRVRAQSSFLAAVMISLVCITAGSILILQFETGDSRNIQTGGDALWWSVVTMTTVGYGDYYPVSIGGRIVAICLMIVGIGIFGTFTGLVASWFVEEEAEAEQASLKELRDEIRKLRDEVAAVSESLHDKR